MAQMTALYGEDYPTLWGQKGGSWNHDQAGSLNAVHDLLGQQTFSPSHLYFTNAEGEKIWQLPYEMNSDFAEPKLLPNP